MVSPLWQLSPGDLGELAVCLDDCPELGDDETTDRLTKVCSDLGVSGSIAYHIVHNLKRMI
jgi:hypothetical protein